MTAIETAAVVLHFLFGAAWAGGALFTILAVLPAARSGDIHPVPCRS